MNKLAFSVDITKAFLQIGLAEVDRNAVRFLWFRDPPFETENPAILELRFRRVVFGVSASPFLLAATIRHHLKSYYEQYPTTCSVVNECLYMDDLLSGSDSLGEAITRCREVKSLFEAAGMQLQKWRSNSPELLSALGMGNNKPTGPVRGDVQKTATDIRILGLTWVTETDEFVFDLEAILGVVQNQNNSKRSVLQISARLFDPIGFISPFVIRAKLMFQELWQRGCQWDERLPEDVQRDWENWLAELHQLQFLRIPRCSLYGDRNAGDVMQIHAFSDASERAYGAVIYIRHGTSAGLNVNLLISKSRVAPIRKLTLPRLELMGAVISARLVAYVKNLFPQPTRTCYWTDSNVTLCWIKGNANRWKPFVANRVSEIQNLTDPSEWTHCDGRQNPADLLTRGISVKSLITSELWWHGPNWLSFEEEDWPHVQSGPDDKESEVELCHISELTTQAVTEGKGRHALFDLGRYSSLIRVLRVTAWIMRFVRNCKNSCKDSGSLTDIELRRATIYWVRIAQEEHFGEELKLIASGRAIHPNSKLKDLSVSVDEQGLLYVKTRLEEASLSIAEKHPWVLPTTHRLTDLLIQDCHKQLLHSGVAATLTCLRERYWIVKARRKVKSILSRCIVCRKATVKAECQEVSTLPKDRVTQAPPFETSGLDFCGPVYVRSGTKIDKAYILLITCAVTRAIHLELVENLTTAHFLMAFRRFVSRRGLPRTLYSDNAATFKGANNVLCEVWKKLRGEEVRNYFGLKGIRWIWIVPLSAWWGGFWERLVRSVKGPLRKILGRACLSYTEMETTLHEVEAVLNSRPLTYTYSDPEEMCSLTPAHFLIGKRIATLPNNTASRELQETNLTRKELIKRQRYREKLLQDFWVRWRKEYLLELRTAHFRKQPKTVCALKVDDLVLVHEDKIPRHLWKMGRIKELYSGRDNKVRCALIQIPGGKTIKRSVQHLYPLEVNCE